MRLKSQKSAGHLRVVLDDRQRDLRGQQAFFNELLRESLTSQQERARRMVSGLVGGKGAGIPAVATDATSMQKPEAEDPFAKQRELAHRLAAACTVDQNSGQRAEDPDVDKSEPEVGEGG